MFMFYDNAMPKLEIPSILSSNSISWRFFSQKLEKQTKIKIDEKNQEVSIVIEKFVSNSEINNRRKQQRC